MEAVCHKVKTIWVNPKSREHTHWFELTIEHTDGSTNLVTLFGDGKMPEVRMGELE
jgi:hypothetical protein